MLTEVFYWVLNMSIIGSVMGAFVLMIRKISRVPRFFIYLLWSVPFIRFWLPIGMSWKYSLVNLISKVTTHTVMVYQPKKMPSFVMANTIMVAKAYFPIQFKSNTLAVVFQKASLIWVIAACAFLLTALLLYIFTKSEVKSATHLKDNVYLSRNITAPAVYGVFKPRILLPAGLEGDDLKYVLLHENAHLHRRDNLFRCVALATACLHWFNPFVWLFLKHYFEDMELACDAKVLKSLDVGGQKEYARALLNCVSSRSLMVSAFGGAKLKVRLQNILQYQRLTLASSLCFGALLLAIAVALLTNAQIP